jgi:lipoprotein-anchoring transpeptidase ErfK/SrfK
MLHIPARTALALTAAMAFSAVTTAHVAAQPEPTPRPAPAPEQTPAVPPPAAPAQAPAPPAPSAPAGLPATPQAPQAPQAGAPSTPPEETQPPAEAPPPNPVPPESVTPQAIDSAVLQPDLPAAEQSPALLVRVEVLLDRAHNSPGAIDGRPGRNLEHALGIYAHEHHLQPGLSPALLSSLEAANGGPITQTYTITAKDETGPFIGHLPSDFYAQSKLRHMGYTGPEEELAERFHMGQHLLEAMNPGADFSKPGTQLLVVRPHTGGLRAQVAKIEVDKSIDQVMAYDASGKLVASFPSTIGSPDHPAPRGDWAVATVRPDPKYIYDPRVLTWGPRKHGRFTIASGPNNPTGVIWIGLTKPTYGIHGSPNAELIGKTSSHGCVRLTNWDAWDLGNAVKPGAAVDFVEGARKQAT